MAAAPAPAAAAASAHLTKVDIARDTSHKNSNAAAKDFYTLHYDLCNLARFLEKYRTQREREKREAASCAPSPPPPPPPSSC